MSVGIPGHRAFNTMEEAVAYMAEKNAAAARTEKEREEENLFRRLLKQQGTVKNLGPQRATIWVDRNGVPTMKTGKGQFSRFGFEGFATAL